ncbi:MAG TPA: serine/threonine-protein kinase [Anaeromyxobacteraceae bacterium]|nr:serine/threonine-protein kinase [Anaeromyxobacteraceae bacterium]
MPVCPTCRTPSEEGVLICPVDGTPLPQGEGLVGQTLADRYRILTRIGEGGMGTVYLCEHVALGKRMAVKVLRPEFSRDEELLRRFQHEARAASQIGQENIIDVFDFGHTAEGSAYFVMEALEGESLARVINREGALSLTRALPILMQICRALGAAHQRGIVHRDLKPENVFVVRREDGADFVKVLDFGISKSALGTEGKRLTRAGSIIGTPEYMSPEQASATTVDHRSDIYAFGVVAYEVVTGRLPFQGDTPLATLLKHQSEAPLSPRRLRADLPVEVETLIMRALVKKPEGRQQSMAEVAADLTRAMAAIDLEPLHTPIFGTALAPLMTNQAGKAVPRRSGSRGGTLPILDTDPSVTLREVPRMTPHPSAGRDGMQQNHEIETWRRRRTQSHAAAILGAAALAIVAAALAALTLRRPEGTPPAPPKAEAPPAQEAQILPDPAAPARAQEAANAAASLPPPPPAAAPAAPEARGETPAKAKPPARVSKRRTSKGTPAPKRGVPSEQESGDNAGQLNDILDPYR